MPDEKTLRDQANSARQEGDKKEEKADTLDRAADKQKEADTLKKEADKK